MIETNIAAQKIKYGLSAWVTTVPARPWILYTFEIVYNV
jgi:hypothetical protein